MYGRDGRRRQIRPAFQCGRSRLPFWRPLRKYVWFSVAAHGNEGKTIVHSAQKHTLKKPFAVKSAPAPNFKGTGAALRSSLVVQVVCGRGVRRLRLCPLRGGRQRALPSGLLPGLPPRTPRCFASPPRLRAGRGRPCMYRGFCSQGGRPCPSAESPEAFGGGISPGSSSGYQGAPAHCQR